MIITDYSEQAAYVLDAGDGEKLITRPIYCSELAVTEAGACFGFEGYELATLDRKGRHIEEATLVYKDEDGAMLKIERRRNDENGAYKSKFIQFAWIELGRRH